MTTMKIVVHQNKDARKVINTGLEEQAFVFGTYPEHPSHAVSTSSQSATSKYNAFRGTSKGTRNRYTASRKQTRKKERNRRYFMKMKGIRDEAIARRKFARLTVGTPAQQDWSIKRSVESSRIRLREPVLQFSRSYERASSPESSTNISDGSSLSSMKADHSIDSMIEIFKCRMCPSFAVPEVYECSSGHSVCDECYLVVGHCTLCPNESTFRRVLGMERIASCLKFPCRWKQRGCLELLGPTAWRDHVDSCRHAEVHLNLALAKSEQVRSKEAPDSR